jgi:hypothetical protein
MSSTDKTKLDWISNEWTQLASSSYTAWWTYNSSSLASYDLYKIVISGTATAGSTFIWMRVNNDASASSYSSILYNPGSTSLSTDTDWYFRIVSHNAWSWWPFYAELVMTKASCYITNVTWAIWHSGQVINWGSKFIAVTSIQLSLIQAISGNIKIFGKNF